MKKLKISILLIAVLGLVGIGGPYSESYAFWGVFKTVTKTACKLGKIKGSLPEKKIIELTDMIQKSGDIKKVGKILGNMKLSNEILEDTYMRIILKQGKISKKEAEEFFHNLRGVNGLRPTLSKVAGVSNAKTLGHLNELHIANSAAKNGFNVLSIGKIFKDGSKRITDIDILIKKNGKTFAIEAKHYSSNTQIPMDKFRADMDTLVTYKKTKGNDVIPVFSITNPPSNPIARKILEKEAKRRGIELIYGSPEEQVHLLNQLLQIL